jgi:hypothetical protein
MNRKKKFGQRTLKLIKINQKERLCSRPREMLCLRPRDREINESEKKNRTANFEINKDQSKGKAVSATKRDAVFATKGQRDQ